MVSPAGGCSGVDAAKVQPPKLIERGVNLMPHLDLDRIIHFHSDVLRLQTYLLEPSIVIIIEDTVYYLEELKKIKGG